MTTAAIVSGSPSGSESFASTGTRTAAPGRVEAASSLATGGAFGRATATTTRPSARAPSAGSRTV
jgi:hypothetical protein